MSGSAGTVLILLATASVSAAQPPPHLVEIKLFASTVAIARTIAEECPGTVADSYYLEALRLRLHVVEADHPTFAEEARAMVKVLHEGLAEAPSRQAWCDAVYRLYGANGTMIRGLLNR